VFKSLDGGDHWQAMNTGLTDTAISALAIDPHTPGTVYAGTWWDNNMGHIFKTTNAGIQWQSVGTVAPVQSLAIRPDLSIHVYDLGYYGGVYTSTDAGGSWAYAGLELANT
jgi:hypothetical protein